MRNYGAAVKYPWSIFIFVVLSLSGCTTFREINVDMIRLGSDSQPLYSQDSSFEAAARRLLVDRKGYQLVVWQGRFYLFDDVASRAAFMVSGKLNSKAESSASAAGPFGEMVTAVSGKEKSAASQLLEIFKSMPLLLIRKSNDFFVWYYQDYLYVIGKYESSLQFEQFYILPNTESRFKMGPHGEIVMFEIDNKDSSLKERLLAQFKEIAWPLEAASDDYFVWKYRGRIYILGDRKANRLFAKSHSISYSKNDRQMDSYSIRQGMPGSRIYLNAGQHGEMVVVEDDPHQPDMALKLFRKYLGAENLEGLF